MRHQKCVSSATLDNTLTEFPGVYVAALFELVLRHFPVYRESSEPKRKVVIDYRNATNVREHAFSRARGFIERVVSKC